MAKAKPTDTPQSEDRAKQDAGDIATTDASGAEGTAPEITIDEVANEIAKGYRTFKVFEHGNKVAAKLQSLAQYERDLQVRVDDLKTREQAGNDALAAIVAKGETIEQSARTQIDNAKDEGAKIVTDAQTKAAEIVSKAEGDAKHNADEAARLMGLIESRTAELEGINRQIDEANKTIDSIQSQAGRILGGLDNAKGEK